MKLASIIFAAMAASIQADDSHRELTSLATKWNISEPEFAYGSLSFTLDFKVTDYVVQGQDMVRWTIYDEECKPADGSAEVQLIDSSGSFPSGESAVATAQGLETVNITDSTKFGFSHGAGSGVPSESYQIGIKLNPDTISDNTDLYQEFTVQNQLTAQIRFCTRFELWTPTNFYNAGSGTTSVNPTPFEVNFLETLVTLTVDLTDGFEIGSIAVEPKDRVVRTANQAYQVVGFLCNPDNSVSTSTEALNQGSVVRVCVEPETEAKNDGIKMRSIDSFSFSRDTFTQQAIVGGSEAPNLLTTYDSGACRGSDTCAFETILFANFYSSVGAVNGAGVASMQFGTNRRLRSAGSRNLQDDVAAAAEFELEFDVNQAAPRASSAAAVSTGLLAAAAAIVALI